MTHRFKIYKIFIALLSLALLPVNYCAATAQDFYFTDFTADYYLSKAEDGTSKLHVKEVLSAVFPESNQNHGITRTIPFMNQKDQNRTVMDMSALNIKALRNGEPENINQIVEVDDHYVVYIGQANEYVHGEQVYTLEYDFANVIMEFDASGNNVSGQDAVVAFQELYWDTNGTGWTQRFDQVAARLHFAEDIQADVKPDTWCYVGRYGEGGVDRCTTGKLDDGFSFTAANLKSGENLTFVAQFNPGTFKVVHLVSYAWLIALALVVAVTALFIVLKIRKWNKNGREQYQQYRSLFTAPQYQPPENPDIHVAEGEQIYLGKTKSSYVATLLELAVTKKVSIQKVEDQKKYDWVVKVEVGPSELSPSQQAMLSILANASSVKKGEEIPIKKHTATQTLANYAKDYATKAEATLVKHDYLVKKSGSPKISKANGSVFSTVVSVILKVFSIGFILLVIWYMFDNYLAAIGRWFFQPGVEMIGMMPALIAIIVVVVIGVTVTTIISQQIAKYSNYTSEGIKLAKYLEGLEMYITMAEKDRLKFLQSVKGADTSNAGIVKLYEKLLPWASLFGAEESWVRELAKYYEIADVPEAVSPDLLNGIIASNMLRNVNNVVHASTAYVPPRSYSGGGGSSFSSGGGGGGFSGGGGGGGGGGGW